MFLSTWITFHVLSSLFSLGLADEYSVDGYIGVKKTLPDNTNVVQDNLSFLRSQKVVSYSMVMFQFQININGSENIETISLIISGTGLEFETKTESDISLSDGNIALSKTIDVGRVSATVTLSTRGTILNQIDGVYNMTAGDISNEQVRSFLSVTLNPRDRKRKSSIRQIFSEPLIIHVPSFEMSGLQPSKLFMKERTILDVDLTHPSTFMYNSYVKLYMPVTKEREETNKNRDGSFEAKMYIERMDIANKDELVEELGVVKAVHHSQTGTSEYDTVHLDFDDTREAISIGPDDNIRISSTSVLQDYIGFSNAEIINQTFIYKYCDDFLWFGTTQAEVLENGEERKPQLKMSLNAQSVYEEKGEMKPRVKLQLEHLPKSTGSAYNITASLYLPPHIGFLKKTRMVLESVKPWDIVQEEKSIHYDISRISFPHFTKMLFNISIDVNVSTLTRRQSFDILYEVVYNGWRDDGEFSTAIQNLSIVVGQDREVKELPLEISRNCSCPWSSKLTCACCSQGACLCLNNGHKCAPCDERWKCIDRLPDYDRALTVEYFDGSIFMCNRKGYKGNHGKTFVSCLKENQESGLVQAISPSVAVILGFDEISHYLYGVSNNGRGYVISKDQGQTWMSIPNDTYAHAHVKESFIGSVLDI